MGEGTEQMRGHRRLPMIGMAAAFLVVLGGPFLLRPERMELPANRKLVIISPHSEEIRNEFELAFSGWTAETHQFTVDIEWLDVGGTITAMRWVTDRYQKSPQGIGVDIFFGGGVDPYLDFGPKGFLHRCSISEDVLGRIPQTYAGMELYDAEQRWFGACLAGFGILYNRDVLEILDLPEPKRWDDLGRPEYFTWVASGDPRHSGSIHMAYEIMLQAYGWEDGWRHLVRLGANCRRFSREASAVPLDVSTGDAACGMAIDVYALRAVAEAGEDRMGFQLPSGLTVVNPDGMAVLKGAPHLELAEMFVEFVLSERGQLLWILRAGAPGGPRRHPLYRLPLIPGLAEQYGDDAAVKFDPFAFEGGIEFDVHKKNVRWRILNDLLGAHIIDTHDEVAAAWEAVRHLPADDPRVRRLLEPPLAEDQLLRLADEWDDPAFRGDTVAEWSRAAAQRYRSVAEGL